MKIAQSLNVLLVFKSQCMERHKNLYALIFVVKISMTIVYTLWQSKYCYSK